MSNTISAILPVLQDSANMIGRELVGFIPAAYRNMSANRAGFNQVVNYPIVPVLSAAAVTPAATAPAGTDIVQAAGSVTMDNLRKVSWNWTGEERRALDNGDIAPYRDIIGQTLQQAMRTLVNEMESTLWTATFKGSSRAFGTAAQTPFGTASDLTDLSNTLRIIDDNGTPQPNRHLVVGAAAMVNLRGKQSVLFKVNESGTTEMLRQGTIGELMGCQIHNSYPIAPFTPGTNSGATTDSAGYAIGATTLTLASAGTGTIIAGDVITITGDASAAKYVVKSGSANVASGGTVVLNAPGLRGTLSAATHAITTTAAYTPNIVMHQNAVHLIMRAPDNGDDLASAETVVVTDAFSGLVFQFARYPQYMQSSFELRVLYGAKVVKPEFIATMIG